MEYGRYGMGYGTGPMGNSTPCQIAREASEIAKEAQRIVREAATSIITTHPCVFDMSGTKSGPSATFEGDKNII